MEIEGNGLLASDKGPVDYFADAIRVARFLLWLAAPAGSATQEA